MSIGCCGVCASGRVWMWAVVALGICVGGAGAARAFQSAAVPDVAGIPAASPSPYSPKSVAAGKATFQRLCAECHDEDGKALAQMMGPAADLTDPSRWKYGKSDAHLFRSIRDGAGSAMPVFGKQLNEEQMWQIVHFIRSIGPAANRPSQQP